MHKYLQAHAEFVMAWNPMVTLASLSPILYFMPSASASYCNICFVRKVHKTFALPGGEITHLARTRGKKPAKLCHIPKISSANGR